MTVSKIASKIYQAAKAAATGEWVWNMEWSKAMKKACMETKKAIKSNFVTLNTGDFCEVHAIEGDDKTIMKHEKSRNGLGSTVTTWVPERAEVVDYTEELIGFRI